MNQDSEQNDRGPRKAGPSQAGPRKTGPYNGGARREQPDREGDSQRRYGRSVERRDDVRNQDADRPRFNRDVDRPTFNRSADAERPQFKRNEEGDNASNFRRERSDRYDNRNDERRSTDRPRLNREDDRRQDRNEGPTRPARFAGNTSERPRFNRDDKPRFDRNRNDESRNGGTRGNRGEEHGGKPGRSFGSNSENRFGRTERQERPDARRRDGEGPRFGNDRNTNRSDRDRPGRSSEERPRFSRGEKPSGTSPANRNDSARRDDRFSRSRPDNTSGSPRNRDGRSDNASPKRVGGFNRDTDERNKEQYGNNRRHTDNRNDSSGGDTRFSSRQRKESGDRRTGDYNKAPNYNLEQTRVNDSSKRDRPDRPRPNQSGESERRQPSDPNSTRLNRYIANSGVCSRREADELIARGDISVNGKVITEMGYKVKDGDTVKYGTKTLNPERFVYVLLNKPKDFITTTDDPEERRTVMELVADAGNFRMYPVGRLDRNTTGLLLLTNDGELADKLTHPSNNVRKIYQVELDKPITDEHFEAIKKGVELEDGPIKPDAISIVTPDAYVIGIEIHSGRNRIVRRMFEKFGYQVAKLDRTTYAGLTKKELPRGKWRFLDPKEVVKLKYLNS